MTDIAYISGREFIISYPEKKIQQPLLPIFYNGGHDTQFLFSELRKHKLVKQINNKILFISPLECNWDSDYSPWKAELTKGRIFEGKADLLFDTLKDQVFPYIISHYDTDPEKAVTMGYSLGALASLYFFTKSNLFKGCACVSGSLWYPGFFDYLENYSTVSSGYCYLSLGKGEIKTRNSLMKQNGIFYEKTTFFLNSRIGSDNVFFEWNNGGHSFESLERQIKALLWITGKII